MLHAVSRRPMPLLLLSQSNDGSAHMHFTLRVAKRALAAPPPSMEDIVQRLADPERPACPIVRLDLIQPGTELPYGVSQGDFMVSSARIAAHLIRFAFGQRTPTVLTSMKPRALTSRFTAPKRNLLVEKLQRTYTTNLPTHQNTFAWHLLHAEAPKHVMEAAIVFAAALSKAEGDSEGVAIGHRGGDGHAHPEDDLGARDDGAGAPQIGLTGPHELAVESSAVWTCSCSMTNPHAAPLCAGAGCRQTHCSLCLGLGHSLAFCKQQRLSLRKAKSNKSEQVLPTLPPWLRLPPFSEPLNALEWADRVFGIYYKGSSTFWIHRRRALLAADVLALLDDDGVLR